MPSSHSGSSHSSFGGGFSSGGFSSGGFSSPSHHSYSSHNSWSSSSSLSSSTSSSKSKPSHSGSSHNSNSNKSYTVVDKRVSEAEAKAQRQKAYCDKHSQDHDHMLTNILLWHYLFGPKNDRVQYDYYPKDCESKSGVTFKQGYYDADTGKHFDNIVMPGVENYVTCPHCKKSFLHKWGSTDKADSKVICPYCEKDVVVANCTNLEYVSDKKVLTKEGQKADRKKKAERWWNNSILSDIEPAHVFLVIITLMVIGIIAVPLVKCTSEYKKEQQAIQVGSYSTLSEVSAPGATANAYFVPDLNRNVSYDAAEGNYYDEQTQCWFWFNNRVTPAQWQYWYEGVSNAYGDYGWMEYDTGENTWYVEVSAGNWQPIELKGDRYWHFQNALNKDNVQVVQTPISSSEVKYSDTVTITDTFTYSNFTPGAHYILKMTVTDASTQKVIEEKTFNFTPEYVSGTEEISFKLPAINAGRAMVISYEVEKYTAYMYGF